MGDFFDNITANHGYLEYLEMIPHLFDLAIKKKEFEDAEGLLDAFSPAERRNHIPSKFASNPFYYHGDLIEALANDVEIEALANDVEIEALHVKKMEKAEAVFRRMLEIKPFDTPSKYKYPELKYNYT